MTLKKKVLETALGFIPNGDNSAESQPELSETELIQSRVMLSHENNPHS